MQLDFLGHVDENFAIVTAPLADLLSPQKRYVWDDATETAFKEIQLLFRSFPAFTQYDPSRHLYLQTNASQEWLGAVFAKLGQTERRYDVNKDECLAVVWAIKKYRTYLISTTTGAKEARSKLTRCALHVQAYNFIVEHHLGKENQLADVLLCAPNADVMVNDETEWDDILPSVTQEPLDEAKLNQINVADKEVLIYDLYHEVVDAQENSEHWCVILLETCSAKDPLTWRLLVPPMCRDKVFTYAHMNTKQTICNVKDHFFCRVTWTNMYVSVKNAKNSRPKKQIVCKNSSRRPFETVSLELMEPYLSNALTKTTRVITIVNALEKGFFFVGGIRDNCLQTAVPSLWGGGGGEIVSVYTLWGTRHLMAVYHPCVNPMEHSNQELKVQLQLRLREQQTSRADQLPIALFSLRRSVKAATNRTPADVLLKHNLALPGAAEIPEQVCCEVGYDQQEATPSTSGLDKPFICVRTHIPRDWQPIGVGRTSVGAHWDDLRLSPGDVTGEVAADGPNTDGDDLP
ncbi:hypothetical protein PR048_019628, partial [Dryococelus australis]